MVPGTLLDPQVSRGVPLRGLFLVCRAKSLLSRAVTILIGAQTGVQFSVADVIETPDLVVDVRRDVAAVRQRTQSPDHRAVDVSAGA